MMNLNRWISYVVLGKNPPIRRRRRSFLYHGPIRDWRYKLFVRRHPCAACGTERGVEFAHTGMHGTGSKASDKLGIPLCWWDHWASPQSLHNIGPAAFQKLNGIRFSSIIQDLHAEWSEIQERRREGI